MRPTYKHPKMAVMSVAAPALGLTQGVREINDNVRELLSKIEVLVLMMEHDAPSEVLEVLQHTANINKMLMNGESDLNGRVLMLQNVLFSALK